MQTTETCKRETAARAMQERAQVIQAEYLDTRQVARLLGISPSTLEKARCTGEGPWARVPWCKIGRRVIFRRKDIDKAIEGFLALQLRNGEGR